MTIEPNRPKLRGFGAFSIDYSDERVIGPDGPVKIGHKAFQVLALLVEQEGKLLTKDALFESVWDGAIVSESSLTSVIKELRRALNDDTRAPTYIESVYGRGYRLIPRVITRGREPKAAREIGNVDAVEVPPTGRPPVVIVGSFNDEAIRATHPYLATELREEVICGLARLREIQLIADDGHARSGSGERDYQLTATLLPDSLSTKVIARLKRLHDGRIVWAETMTLAGAGGAADWIEKIVRRIVAAALPALDQDVWLGIPPEAGALYDRFLQAKRLSLTAKKGDEALRARDMLCAIISQRPDFGLAYQPLVRLYNTDFSWTSLGKTGHAERAEALRLAKLGMAADEGNAHAHSVLGFCYLWHGQAELSRRSLGRALALNPYNRVRAQEVATAWTYLGDFDEADNLLARAIELDPVPDSDLCEDIGRLRLARGDYRGAREMLEQVVSGTIWAELYLGACESALSIAGGQDRTRTWLKRIASCWHTGGDPSLEEVRAWVRKHHPFPEDTGRDFFLPIDEALGG